MKCILLAMLMRLLMFREMVWAAYRKITGKWICRFQLCFHRHAVHSLLVYLCYQMGLSYRLSFIAITFTLCIPQVLVTQRCPTLCDPMDCNSSGTSVHGIIQARILEWVATSFSSESSKPRDWACVSCIAGGFFIIWATREDVFLKYWFKGELEPSFNFLFFSPL